VQLHADAVLLGGAHEKVAGEPKIIRGPLGTLAEQLVFPLADHDLGVDSGDREACLDAEVEVFLDNVAALHVAVPDGAVVRPLGSPVAALRETDGDFLLRKDILLLEAEPEVLVVVPAAACVGRVNRPVGGENLAEDEEGVDAVGVGNDAGRFEQTIRGMALGLLGGGTIEGPAGEVLHGGNVITVVGPDLCLAAQIRLRGIAVEPDVFEFYRGHGGREFDSRQYAVKRATAKRPAPSGGGPFLRWDR
jgi:hypothetical protein